MAICSLLCSCLNCEQRVVWREFFSLRAQWRVEPLFGWLGCCHTVGQIPPKFKEFSNLIDCYWCGLFYFSFVCLLKLILFNSKSQNQMCNWNQKCFCFVLQKSYIMLFYMTHTLVSEVSLYYWLLWPTVCHFTIGPNLKNPQKIRLTEICKIDLLTYSCNNLTNFEYR